MIKPPNVSKKHNKNQCKNHAHIRPARKKRSHKDITSHIKKQGIKNGMKDN